MHIVEHNLKTVFVILAYALIKFSKEGNISNCPLWKDWGMQHILQSPNTTTTTKPVGL